MAQTPEFRLEFNAETGKLVPIMPGLARVTAPNSGPFTFTGTNSFLIGDDELAVLDPGPNDDGHLAALQAAIGGRRVVAIILTHTHRDHCGLARKLIRLTGAPLWFEGQHRLSRRPTLREAIFIGNAGDWTLRPDRTLVDAERFSIGGVALEVIATPGHCANHLSFGLTGTDLMLSGDHVMGWNSTLISIPDGSMADYFRSLDKVIAAPFERYWPAHGDAIPSAKSYAKVMKMHREMRNAQVVGAVRNGATTVGQLLAKIYPDLALNLRAAAYSTMEAHVEYLGENGRIGVNRGLLGVRLSPP